MGLKYRPLLQPESQRQSRHARTCPGIRTLWSVRKVNRIILRDGSQTHMSRLKTVYQPAPAPIYSNRDG